ncbi:porin family protein [Pricia sp. S334]|uniref:Porin family protein n=1 Tax=Pricia mediterranea TaxID=3076079 RepID=A0ABU3L8D4_9FLAO|nr:porin family protein [Pricia sp. S334]MDT7830006.1 porin family protein [Pricia sp. S334]
MNFKLHAILAMILFGSAQVYAQSSQNFNASTDTGPVRFGAKAGLGFSTFSGDFADISPKLGFHFGGAAEIPAFSENFYLQPELLLSFQRTDIGIGNLNLTYLQLPLMTKYHITDEIAAEFGPQVGVLVGDNGDDLIAIERNTVDFGINVGAGYRMNDTIYFQLRFGLGVSKLFDNFNSRNRALSLGGVYYF